jgi:hypothetical protein
MTDVFQCRRRLQERRDGFEILIRLPTFFDKDGGTQSVPELGDNNIPLYSTGAGMSEGPSCTRQMKRPLSLVHSVTVG